MTKNTITKITPQLRDNIVTKIRNEYAKLFAIVKQIKSENTLIVEPRPIAFPNHVGILAEQATIDYNFSAEEMADAIASRQNLFATDSDDVMEQFSMKTARDNIYWVYDPHESLTWNANMAIAISNAKYEAKLAVYKQTIAKFGDLETIYQNFNHAITEILREFPAEIASRIVKDFNIACIDLGSLWLTHTAKLKIITLKRLLKQINYFVRQYNQAVNQTIQKSPTQITNSLIQTRYYDHDKVHSQSISQQYHAKNVPSFEYIEFK